MKKGIRIVTVIAVVFCMAMTVCAGTVGAERIITTETDASLGVEESTGTDLLQQDITEMALQIELLKQMIRQMASETDAAGDLPDEEQAEAYQNALTEWLNGLEIKSNDDLNTYLKETVVPWIVAVVSAITTVYQLFYKKRSSYTNVMNTVRDNAQGFMQAQQDLHTAIEERKDAETMKEKVEALTDESAKLAQSVQDLRQMNMDLMSEVRALAGPVGEELRKIKEASLVAWGNTEELVKKGYANEINRIMGDANNEDGEVENEAVPS